jgi:hypothetical protein
MAQDLTIFVGLTESELLTLRSNAISQLTGTSDGAGAGQVITSVSTRDLSVSYGSAGGGDGPLSPDQIVKACNYALQKLDPATYGRDLLKRKRHWSC